MMALYEYKCIEGHTLELSHPMKEEPEVFCGECGARMKKMLGTPWMQFKGNGFYSTDK